jgi:hypothetical protein
MGICCEGPSSELIRRTRRHLKQTPSRVPARHRHLIGNPQVEISIAAGGVCNRQVVAARRRRARSSLLKLSGNLSILRATTAFTDSDAAAAFEVAFVIDKFTSIMVNLVRCDEAHPLCSLRVRCDVDWRRPCCERPDVHVLERRIFKRVEPVNSNGCRLASCA